MKTAVYPGTFDPITNGHVDIVKRGAALFDRIVVIVAANPGKKPLFDADERAELVSKALEGIDNVEVEEFDGLLADYVNEKGAVAIIRGLRAVSDFEYEFQMSLMNRKLAPDVETVFLTPAQEYIHLNSTIIREIASLAGDVSDYVPPVVKERLKEKFGG